MNVKNVLMALAAVFCANLAAAQHPVLKTYAENPEAKRVFVSEEMLGMVNESLKGLWIEKLGLEKVPMTLNTFELISVRGDAMERFLKKDMKKVVTKKYKQLIVASGDNVTVSIYGIGEKTNLTDMVIILTTEEALTAMVMTGDIDFDELAKAGPKFMEKMPMPAMSGFPGMPAVSK